MFNFDLDLFTHCWATITSLRSFMDANGPAIPEDIEALTSELMRFSDLLGSMGLRMSKITIDKLILHIDGPSPSPSGSYTGNLITEFIIRFREESGISRMFVVDPSAVHFYEQPGPLFGSRVADSFPSAEYDIAEGGKAYALERSTACVLHMMRVLEVGLNAMAANVGVTFERRNWENIIGDIEKAIRDFSAGSPKPANWKQKEKFYADLAKDFRYLKNAWRNNAMHVRDKYTSEEARVIFDYTASFMKTLADGGLKELP